MKNIRNTILRLSLLMSAAGVVAMTPSSVFAQTSVQGSQSRRNGSGETPYQQRLSPYLDLLRNDNSALSPYHSFVQPRRQVQQNQNFQASQIQRIQRTIERPVTRSPQIERTQTGRGGTFNNYLHYYQFNSIGNH
ncbi:hypothetical protein SH528x_003714 [Novipirellula sp. SH528]|uniref:hypothetical protein n=1 Tax=Novipirellula sp. SH528 TaxID=3454466 RepID=UPI003F9F7AD5